MLYALAPLALVVLACLGFPWCALAAGAAIGYFAVVCEFRYRPQGGYPTN